MTAVVTIEHYDEEEATAKCDLSYVEMEAFATTTLAIFGYPTTVTRERELSRYVDWNNSPSNAQYFRRNYFVRGPSVETSFTPVERRIAEQVSDTVAALTARCYGREMRPISALLSQFGLFRAIMALHASEGRPLTVFEVGPGNGYLGAMLAAAGVYYIGFDNAQALYLWQNRLLAECAGEAFHDWVGAGPPNRAGVRLQHLPWWHYLQLRHECSIKADVFVSNTNLGEMNYGALKYTVRIAREILRQSPLAAFLFTNIGDAKQNSMATVEHELAAAGFDKACSNLLHAYVPRDMKPLLALRKLDERIPLYNPDNMANRVAAREILKVTPATLPSDMNFLEFTGTFKMPDEGQSDMDGNQVRAIGRDEHSAIRPNRFERLRTVFRNTRRHGLSWLARRLAQKYARARSR